MLESFIPYIRVLKSSFFDFVGKIRINMKWKSILVTFPVAGFFFKNKSRRPIYTMLGLSDW